jgi:hypothetical protein
MLSFLKCTQRSAFEAISNNTSIFKTYLTSAPLLASIAILSPFFSQKVLSTLQNLAKMKYVCKKSITSLNQEMFAISLSWYSRYNANLKLDQSVFAIHDSPPYFEISEDDHARTVTHARDHWYFDEVARVRVGDKSVEDHVFTTAIDYWLRRAERVGKH